MDHDEYAGYDHSRLGGTAGEENIAATPQRSIERFLDPEAVYIFPDKVIVVGRYGEVREIGRS